MLKRLILFFLHLFIFQSAHGDYKTDQIKLSYPGVKILDTGAMFPETKANETSTATVTYTNDTLADSVVTAVDASNSTLPPEIWYWYSRTITETFNSCLGQTIPPGGSCEVGFRYAPLFYGDRSYTKYTWHANTPGNWGNLIQITVSGRSILPPADTINPPPPKNPLCKTGSIIDVDDQILRERIPLVGTDFSLFYSSTYSKEFVSGYNYATRIRSFNPEGFSVSVHNHLAVDAKRLFKGDGTSQQVVPFYSGGYSVVDGDEILEFDSAGYQLSTKSVLTGAIKYTFSYLNYRLSTITDAYGKQTIFNRNSAGVLLSVQGPFGQTTSVTVNSQGLLSSISNPKNETYLLTYKSGTTLLETFTKPGGQVSTFTYDGDGRLTKDLGHGGNFTEFVRSLNSAGTARLLNEISAEGTNPFYEFWGIGGDTHRYYEDNKGQQRENGQLLNGGSYDWTPTEATYTEVVNDGRFQDALKRVSKVEVLKDYTMSTTLYSQVVTDFTGLFNYTSITSTTNTSGRIQTSVFTKSNKTHVNTSHEGATSSSTLDAHERVVSSKTGNDTPWTFTYNSLGQLVEVTQGLRNTVTNTYYSNGLLEKSTNVLGQETSYVYDLAGRPTQTTLPNGKVVLSSYDLNGNLVGVTPPSRPEHIFSLNNLELIGQYQPPALVGLSVKDTLYTYNLEKQLTNILRPDGQSVAMVYDSSYTDVLQEVQLSRGTSTYTYPAGSSLMSQATSADGISSSFQYYGRTLKSEDQKRTSDGYLYAKYSYEFDGDHRQISRTLRGHSVTSSSTVATTYNNDDMPVQIGDLNIAYEYPSGRLSTTSLVNISDARTYDAYGSLASYSSTYTPTTGPAQALYSYSLVRDLAGRITQKTETVLGIVDVFAYTYDVVGRLSTVTKNSNPYSSYVYDDNGNRTSGVHATHPFTATYDSQDRMLTYNSRVYGYNANGDNTLVQWNTTQQSTFSYDALGSLIGAVNKDGRALAFKYDSARNLVQTDLDGATTTRRIYENEFRIAAQYTNGGNDVKEFIYFTNVNSPDYMIYAGAKYRLLKDHLGSTRLVIKVSDGTVAQRIDYTDLGKITANTNTSFQPYAFAGGINENYTKLVKFGARFYDAETGRWTSKDPILFKGGNTNLFGYVSNDPVNWIDPSGLRDEVACRGAAAACSKAGESRRIMGNGKKVLDDGEQDGVPLTSSDIEGLNRTLDSEAEILKDLEKKQLELQNKCNAE